MTLRGRRNSPFEYANSSLVRVGLSDKAPIADSATAPTPPRGDAPGADVPALRISMPTLDPARLLELGRRLAPEVTKLPERTTGHGLVLRNSRS